MIRKVSKTIGVNLDQMEEVTFKCPKCADIGFILRQGPTGPKVKSHLRGVVYSRRCDCKRVERMKRKALEAKRRRAEGPPPDDMLPD